MHKYVLYTLLLMLVFGCQDWRRDAFEDKRFDPSNAFVRFNYENTVSEPALDSIRLSANVDTVIFLPIALSAPEGDEDLQLFWEAESSGWSIDQIGITTEDDAAVNPLIIESGTFDEILHISLPAIDTGRFEIRITEVSPEVSIGYPGSGGRGSQFTIIVP